MEEKKTLTLTQVALAPGDGCLVMRASGQCELIVPAIPGDEALSEARALLTAIAIGMGERDQRLHDVLALIINERHELPEKS